MPEIMIEGLANLVPQFLSLIAPDKAGWRYGLYRIEGLAQDQVVFEVDRGKGQETYYGRRILAKDAQSDAALVHAAKSKESVAWPDMRELLNSYLASAWEVDEPTSETEQQRDDEIGMPDESDTECTADHLANRLLEIDAANDWSQLRELIQHAEDTGFSPKQSKKLAPRLLGLAMQYRDSRDPQDKPAVWSAIRTGGSMLRPKEIGRLRPLLEPGHRVETSLVAVKMLGRIFEAQPPAGVDQYPELAAEVRQIVESLLNRYAIASSQSAAMAQLAIYALAAMASSATVEIAKAVHSLGQSWFTVQTGRELRELRDYWNGRPTPVAARPRELLEQAIRELNAD